MSHTKRCWKRYPKSYNHSRDDDNYYQNLVPKRPKFREKGDNGSLDIRTKRAALKVASSVVALVSYSDEEEIMQGSGTIIERNNVNNIVLTSANLIRRSSDEDFMENNLVDNLKVIVYSHYGTSYEGEVVAYDYHYNLAAISFHSEVPFSTATMADIDDSLDVSASPSLFEFRPNSSSYKLEPGANVVAVGRYFSKPFDLMTAPGAYWLDRCEYDCKELFTANCFITRCGQGGPLVNDHGEVIGITYYDWDSSIPCMPISIAYKWWEHYKTYRKYRRPFLGLEATNFYAADVAIMERVNLSFPNICNGVIVEEVTKGSSADLAGLRVNDVIFECCGKPVHSLLEFFGIIWDKVGDHVELALVRQDEVEPIHLNMLVVEATLDQYNRWPVRDNE